MFLIKLVVVDKCKQIAQGDENISIMPVGKNNIHRESYK